MIHLVLTMVVALIQSAPMSNASAIALAPAAPVAEIDLGRLKGDLVMLAWSPDGTEFYLQTVERDRRGAVTATHHYIVKPGSKAEKGIDAQPAWAATYWTWKSGQASPAIGSFKIAVEERTDTKRAVAAVGDLAKGGGSADGRGIPGTSSEEATAVSAMTQVQHVFALRLRNEPIGEWINEPVRPGTNWSWAPAPHAMIVYTKRDGGPLILLDEQGRKQELAGAAKAMLPAWSNDGTKIAWLERKDRKTLDLMVAGVTVR